MVRRGLIRAAIAVMAISLSLGGGASLRSQQPQQSSQAAAAVASPEDLGATQERLMKLLRVSPTLAEVVASDPSLLADQQYVAKSNPELAAFLQQHPEIGRNPSFWLFSQLRTPQQERYQVLEPKRGFEQRRSDPSRAHEVTEAVVPPIVMVILFLTLGWIIRVLMENRRWTKVFTLQSQVHAKLIDRFASNQELLGYMETDAGRRFLEAAPIVMETDSRRMPNFVSRMIATLQVGLVLTLLGAGLLALRNAVGDAGTTMLVLGIVALMPGIGLILSAAVLWMLGKRLNLMEMPNVQVGVDLRGRE